MQSRPFHVIATDFNNEHGPLLHPHAYAKLHAHAAQAKHKYRRISSENVDSPNSSNCDEARASMHICHYLKVSKNHVALGEFRGVLFRSLLGRLGVRNLLNALGRVIVGQPRRGQPARLQRIPVKVIEPAMFLYVIRTSVEHACIRQSFNQKANQNNPLQAQGGSMIGKSMKGKAATLQSGTGTRLLSLKGDNNNYGAICDLDVSNKPNPRLPRTKIHLHNSRMQHHHPPTLLCATNVHDPSNYAVCMSNLAPPNSRTARIRRQPHQFGERGGAPRGAQ
jgi:hypothetical protein